MEKYRPFDPIEKTYHYDEVVPVCLYGEIMIGGKPSNQLLTTWGLDSIILMLQ
jgi:hypothetical protein